MKKDRVPPWEFRLWSNFASNVDLAEPNAYITMIFFRCEALKAIVHLSLTN